VLVVAWRISYPRTDAGAEEQEAEQRFSGLTPSAREASWLFFVPGAALLGASETAG
jgi:hypothetical protein